MWISRKVYDEVQKQRFEAQGVSQALERQAIATKTTMDWLMVRLTQLEHERAQLIFNYMGVKITVPEILPSAQVEQGSELLNDIPSFSDIGDDEAKRQGFDWDSEGRVTQHGKAIS